MKKTFLVLVLALLSINNTEAASVWAPWTNGPPTDPNFFPIVANYQHAYLIDEYDAMGMTVMDGLDYPGVNAATMLELKNRGMYLIGDIKDDTTWNYRNDPTYGKIIIGWGHITDEPDNYQHLKIEFRGRRWPTTGHFHSTACVLPDTSSTGVTKCPTVRRIPPVDFIDAYDYAKSLDSTRPILCYLGCGVAYDGWWGRGSAPAGGWPAEYTEYCKGMDVPRFDVYPIASTTLGVEFLWYQQLGLDRLKTYSSNLKPVSNIIETTKLAAPPAGLATPAQVRSQVWISLIYGASMISYFLHEMYPDPITAGIFLHPEIVAEVTKINTQIKALAPVLNTANTVGKVTATSSTTVSIDIMVKEYNGFTYIFSAGMRNGSAVGTFTVSGLAADTLINVLGESRTITAKSGYFTDSFVPWDVHIYQFGSATSGGGTTNPLTIVRNYPNPISLSTGNKKARFDSIAVQDVKIDIYNSEGSLVRTVYERDYGNMGTAEWDLKDTGGTMVAAGMYYFVVEDGNGNKKKGKLALVR